MIDHLVYTVPDLDEGVALIEEKLGVRAAAGGKHLGRGTHNALLSLGNGSYFEIIAPDPEQDSVSVPRAFGLDAPGEPRLYTWAAQVGDIESRLEAARAAGYKASLLSMTRELPDGNILRWVLTYPPPAIGDGLVPFLIHWEPGPHPSETSPAGCRLLSLAGEHPDPPPVRALLRALGVDLVVTEAPAPALLAMIDSPKGVVQLR
jgi:catechol 2,3-dioxygenase-like lactoylglutathione lyase family enzyme